MDDRHLMWYLRRIDRKLNALLIRGFLQMATLAELTIQVQKNADVEQSAIILIQGIAQALKDAIAANDPAKIAELQAQLATSADALAAAVVAGTSEGPPPPSARR